MKKLYIWLPMVCLLSLLIGCKPALKPYEGVKFGRCTDLYTGTLTKAEFKSGDMGFFATVPDRWQLSFEDGSVAVVNKAYSPPTFMLGHTYTIWESSRSKGHLRARPSN